jgi:hypothetical protein
MTYIMLQKQKYQLHFAVLGQRTSWFGFVSWPEPVPERSVISSKNAPSTFKASGDLDIQTPANTIYGLQTCLLNSRSRWDFSAPSF